MQLEANAKVDLKVANSSLGGEFKTIGEITVERTIVRSADHHGKADNVYKGKRKKFGTVEVTRTLTKADWDNKTEWLALDHDTVTITEIVFDADTDEVYGKGLVITGETGKVTWPKRDLASEDGLAELKVEIDITNITEGG